MKTIVKIILLYLLVFVSTVFAQEARKIDEIGNLIGYASCEDYLNRMDTFQVELANNPNSKGYVIIYEGKITKYNRNKPYYVLPQFGEATAIINTMKSRLRFINRTSPERTIFINAGFRENLTVELWIVPDDATLPIPTPTLRKMKYRTGKPKGFCVGCCG